MASKVTIWDNERTADLEESAPVNITGQDFVTLFASGVSGVGQVECRVSPDGGIFHRSSVSGLDIADEKGHSIAIPERGTHLKILCDVSGNYNSWIYMGTYTYNFPT